MLLLALWMNPGAAKPADWPQKAALVPAEVPDSPAESPKSAPQRLTVLDVVGKACLAVLLIYGVSFGLKSARGAGLLQRLCPSPPPGPTSRLQLRESLTLGKQQGALYLIELDGQALLLGLTTDQWQLLWQAAPDQTTSFPPVVLKPEEPVIEATVPLEMPRVPRVAPPPARAEADWAQERSRLISALVQTD